jgi:hypothetical protein
MPRIYDVEGEKLHLRVRNGEKDVWYPISHGELRNIVEDGLAALMRQMRKMERDKNSSPLRGTVV